MSIPTPVPQPDDFDTAVDAFVGGAAQPQGSPAPAPVADPPQSEAAQPATAPQQQAQEPTTTPESDDSDDEALDIAERFTRAQKREQRLRESAKAEVEAERRKVLSYQGNLAQEAKRREALAADLERHKALLADENQRLDGIWDNAIAQAPEQSDDPRIATKSELRQHYDLQKRERDLAQKEQQARFVEEQAQQQQQAARETHFQTMREVATAELPILLDQAAQALGLPATLLTPVKEYVNSPAVRALARRLPIFPEGQALAGDPAGWQLDQIGSLHELRQHLERQAELGLDHFTKQHQAGAVKENVQAATKTYRQEQPIGAATAKRGKDWAEMDEDEAFDAWFAQRH